MMIATLYVKIIELLIIKLTKGKLIYPWHIKYTS